MPLTVADAYRRMATIRRFEEQVLKLSHDGEIEGSVHLCLGQEAIPVGAMAALLPRDRILSTYRGHGWALAAGSDPLAVMAEILHRADGLNGGRVGSALLSDPEVGFLGENSIVGAGVPIAAGVAMAAVVQETGRVVLVSIGDGAMNQGATTEGMIFAASRNLPVIFLCENNGWSEMTRTSSLIRNADLAERGRGLGIESHVVDGTDPYAVCDAVAAAATACRDGRGPVLLECKAARLGGHYNRDIEHYRSREDKDEAVRADPLQVLRARRAEGLLDEAAMSAIDAEVAGFIERISFEALHMPRPDVSTARQHVSAEPSGLSQASVEPPQQLTYQRALNAALADELEERPDLLVYGEDVGHPGGIFGVSRGLQKKFGAERVFDTPIAESAILGSAVGAGLEGVNTVVEIMWADFAFVALDQIVNQAANVRYINRSKLHAPMTVRIQQGATPGSCAQHSQSIEALLAHVPGIKIGLPSTPRDAYEMLRAAIADPDPTVIIEHRALYQETGEVAIGGSGFRASGARRHRDGNDVSIITWGAMVGGTLTAADLLAERGVHATVLDLRWLRPLDMDSIAAAVRVGGGRVLVVHQDTLSGGFGAEVVARITERHFGELVTPVSRLATPDSRMPAAGILQQALIPDAMTIFQKALRVARL